MPYILAFNPVMILEGDYTTLMVGQVVVTSLVGLFGIAAALNGNLFCKVNPVFRLLLAAGGIMMMVPGTLTDVIGVAVIAAISVLQYLLRKRQQTPSAPAAA